MSLGLYDSGQAEHFINRCHFTNCTTGAQTWDWNSMDEWFWYCLFQNCGKGVFNEMGNYHVYNSVFLGSTVADCYSNNNMAFTIDGNTSIGSQQFIAPSFIGDPIYIRGNKVYDTVLTLAAEISGGSITAMDNLFASQSGASGTVLQWDNPGDEILAGNTYTTPGWSERPINRRSGTNIANAIDDNTGTTFYDSANSGEFLRYTYANNATNVVTAYTITSGSDSQDRDPYTFSLYGSTDFGHSWTLLDTRTGVVFPNRLQKQTFSITNSTAYGTYELDVNATYGFTNGDLCGREVAEFELLNGTGADTTDDHAGCLSGSGENWGECELLDASYVSKSSVPTPTSVALPPPPPNNNRTIYEVQQNTGNDAQAIQTQINNAVNGNTTRPVVHIPMGTYSIGQSITVPANFDIQIVGDGGTMEATQLNWSGSGAGPLMLLNGPSRATLRDFYINGGTVDGLWVTNANQVNGQIYTEILDAGGGGGSYVANSAVLVNGTEDSNVTLVCGTR